MKTSTIIPKNKNINRDNNYVNLQNGQRLQYKHRWQWLLSALSTCTVYCHVGRIFICASMVLCYACVLSDMTGLHRANTQDDIFNPKRNYSDPHTWCYFLAIKQPSECDRGISCCNCTRYCDKLSLIERPFTKSKRKDLGWNWKQKQALAIYISHHKMQTAHYS
jgi:hypothetical protein